MLSSKMNIFEIVLLIVGIGVGILGFQLINKAYTAQDNQLSWLMIIAIFNWLTLLVMFILLSLMVDVAKRELNETKTMIYLLSENLNKSGAAKKK